eukprot:scaffold57409_cov63-Phaeocystis_antarctica.AAC.5
MAVPQVRVGATHGSLGAGAIARQPGLLGLTTGPLEHPGCGRPQEARRYLSPPYPAAYHPRL